MIIFQGDNSIINALLLHKRVVPCLITLYDHPLTHDEREKTHPSSKLPHFCLKLINPLFQKMEKTEKTILLGNRGHVQQVRDAFMTQGDICYCCEDVKCEGHKSVTNALGWVIS